MKNILFIGPYLQNDGWGNAAREYLRALRLTGNNIMSRPIHLNGSQSVYNKDEFNDLETPIKNIDTVIQNCLPSCFVKFPNVKNIGLSFFESTINNTTWPTYIKLMDELWVCSAFEKDVILGKIEGINVKVVPFPTNITKYNTKYIAENPLFHNHNNSFKFYFIGENSYRKNIMDLVLSFVTEFTNEPKVRLILKVNNVTKSWKETNQNVSEIIEQAKKISGLQFLDNQIEIIPQFLSTNDLFSLHQSCDCFVTASRAEGFCIPAFDALGFGKFPIVNENSSMNKYIVNKVNGLFVKSYKTPCFAEDRPASYLYTSKDYWYNIDIMDMMKNMRLATELNMSIKNHNLLKDTTRSTMDFHSYNNVKNTMKEYL